ncbi:hypothetical protein HHL19_26120 [Streptomyces sp. R302]|uniref:DUF6083 domain-containing protein n=1 Tax=unclassified Streptomyces TaxID=2593676 RepID=UPI00145F3E1D|nr:MULTISPECIES: DUF6083 domain-containing protein [unclassified Streptomyces]NML53676.1 hypothetical protein [Streptomyces sp. R301]NML82037.1 hypothetical protein [Streptomyces sp. R302]
MAMHLHRSNGTMLLRRDAVARCKHCGTPIEWFDRYDGQRIPLSMEFPARPVPVPMRWYTARGLAHPGADPNTGQCRIPHPAICPALEHTDLPPEIEDLVGRLAVRMRKRIDQGLFLPEADRPADEPRKRDPEPSASSRHVVSLYSTLHIAPGEVQDIRCTALHDDGARCENRLFDRKDGRWEETAVPRSPGRQGQRLLSATGGRMWVWSIREFNHTLRWRRQLCTDHDRGDVLAQVPNELVPFSPLAHGEYVLGQRPAGYDRPPADEHLEIHTGPKDRTVCAGDGCSHASSRSEPTGWLCWQCVRVAKRRARIHQQWQASQPSD